MEGVVTMFEVTAACNKTNANSNMVPYLNPDVMELIFKHVNGKTLARCEQVCKLWKELVQKLSQHTQIWKTCCEKEINGDVRIELLSTCYPSWHILCPSNYEWRVVYTTWCQWQHIGKWSFITRIFEDTSLTKVTCMKISGRCIITGHNNGDVLLWACSNHVMVASHLRPVTALGVMVYIGECNDNSHQLKHEFVVSASLDCTIHVNPLTFQDEMPHGCHVIRDHLLPVTNIRTFRNMFAALSYGDSISVWQLCASTSKKIPAVIKLHELQTHTIAIEAISIWGDEIIQVSAVIFTGLSIPIFRGDDSSPCKLLQAEAYQHSSSACLGNKIPHIVVKAFLWRYGVSIVLDDQHYMYVTVNECGQMVYNTMPYLHSYPVTVLLYGEILLLGMESGTLYMYHVDQIKDLLTLDLGEVYWKLSLCSEPIIDLDIDATSSGPVIAAATNSRVWYITFVPPGLR